MSNIKITPSPYGTWEYIPAGGMALTAEQVEDVRALVWLDGRRNFDAFHRLRALFPATEPAAVRDGGDLVVVERSHTAKAVQSWMTLDLWTDLGKNDKDFDAEYERQGFGDLWAILLGEVRALVQATEPAEDSVGDPLQAWKEFLKPKPIGWYRTMTPEFATKHFGFPGVIGSKVFWTHTASDGGKWAWDDGDWELLVYPPAPAEPAEEKTKAKCLSRWDELRCGLDAGHAGSHEQGKCSDPDWAIWPGDHANPTTSAEHIEEEAMLAARGEGWYEGYEVGLEYGPIAASGEEYDGPINPYDVPASSPVAPAPTETEWQTWQEVPEGVKYYGVGDTYLDEPVVYVNRPSVVRHRVDDGKRSSTPDYEVESFAPFVAAEEK
ncbi:hypothetical protein [Rhodococcus sp. 3-2]|uniref:hypothetical protein n=1 Tax=Rhodococcus sp. 3-2 TaxID=2890836 RepID=UPI001D189D8C|nr:hypothetical protein [Rhodococcus sp. 3-2]MCC4300408.1 hypothetical protein [Rhodococcus sp. 3-2]MCC4300468.1 hypothetical protein [Rhodococcus sp. 3-2]